MYEEKKLTGYPSIDRPWLKYYSEEAILGTLSSGKSLYDNIYDNNKDNPNDIALRFFGNVLTYQKLFSMIEEAESKLTSLGIKQDDVVAFISITTPDLIAIFYALNKIGAVSCMLDPRSSVETIHGNLESAKASFLFVLDACNDQINPICQLYPFKKVVLLSTNRHMGQPAKFLYRLRNRKNNTSSLLRWENVPKAINTFRTRSSSNKDNTPALICYTGGTTGNSKGVLLTNWNINSVIEQFRLATGGFERQQKWLTSAVPFVTYTTICGMHMPLSFGMDCYIELYNVRSMVKKVIKHRINHFAATPVFYEELYKIASSTDLSFVIMPTTGADKLSTKTYEKMNELFKKNGCKWKICNGYGMTEVSSASCVSFNNECNKAGSVGIPLLGTIVTAFDINTGHECKINESGEICIAGPGVMSKYLGDPSLTTAVIKEHDGRRWMHTGDIGHVDMDGCVFIEGRIKRMIVRYDGFKVFPTEVEEKISISPNVKHACCVGIDDSEHETGQLPVVFVVPENAHSTHMQIETELRQLCDKELSAYSRPVKYFFLESLPVTHAAKTDYRALERMAANIAP